VDETVGAAENGNLKQGGEEDEQEVDRMPRGELFDGAILWGNGA
jgi:hypothetical protein